MIPKHTKEGFERYLNYKYKPGSFCLACLQNRRINAIQCADSVNIHHIPEIFDWLDRNMPLRAWGSVEKVEKWLHRETDESSAKHGEMGLISSDRGEDEA
ncbi:hypothetical protein KAR91_70360 [Candidatus Pacearchaeota archaeon]|nr:hypothetical protein [Candidatus Pacearchaeota archaeon]